MSDEQIDMKGPGGFGFSFRGNQMFPVILVLLLAAIFFYLFFQSDSKADDRDKKADERAKETITAIQEFRDAATKADSTQKAMIYVLSLSQEERQRLNLMKPKELSDMQR